MNIMKKLTPNPKVEIVISNRTVVRVMIVVVLTLIGLAALQKVSGALILIFLAFFLALALNAPVHWLAEHLPGKRRGSRSLATTLSFLLVVVVLAGFIAAIAPPAIRQVNSFINTVPGLVRDVQDQNSGLGKFVRQNNLENATDNLSDELSNIAKKSGAHAISTVSKIGTSIFALFTVLAMTFMMLVEGPRWLEVGRRLLPEDKQEYGERMVRDMYKVVRGYVNGQVTLALVASVTILVAMLVLHVPYASALAVIVFFCALIPVVGHFIGATIVTLIALTHSLVTALAILAFYILYQQIENYVVQPRIQASSTNMSPLLVFIAVIIGVNLNGLLGGFVAIPVAGCIRIWVVDYLKSNGRLAPAEAKAETVDTK
jgi:predicted PurR-regulated permease PerM